MAFANPEDIIRQSLAYNPGTGELRWRRDTHNRFRLAGEVAGNVHPYRGGKVYYRTIHIAGREYLAHRLAWFIHHGEWPQHHLDHINRDGWDNRIANLRSATRSQNAANRKRVSDNPFKGVFPLPSGRWRASHKCRHLGVFSSPEEAQVAYMKAARATHGEFARAG